MKNNQTGIYKLIKFCAAFYFPWFYLRFEKQLAHIRKKNIPAIFLMGTPVHGNLGDQAIVYAERAFFERGQMGEAVIEISYPNYLCFGGYIQKRVNPSDVIIIDGGGSMGTLWKSDDKISDIISRFKNNKIIVFPQTCYYRDDHSANIRLKRNKSIYSNANDLKILLRDSASYQFVNQHFNGLKIFLIPDIVLSVKNLKNDKNRDGVLFIFREDHEKVTSNKMIENITTYLEARNILYTKTSTKIKKVVTSKNRNIALYKKWAEFFGAGLVITDRLHGMIFAAITETPCIALDNLSKKISGTYDFIKELSYICCLKDETNITAKIEEMYKMKGKYNFSYPEDVLKGLL